MKGHRRREHLIERDGGKCFYCGVPLKLFRFTPFYGSAKGNQATIDHIIPRSKGGTDSIDNQVISCAACNNERGDRDAFEFLAEKCAAMSGADQGEQSCR